MLQVIKLPCVSYWVFVGLICLQASSCCHGNLKVRKNFKGTARSLVYLGKPALWWKMRWPHG